MQKVIKIVKELRASSSMPLVVIAEDKHTYLLKLSGGGEGSLVHFIDYLATLFCKVLNIPFREPCFINLEADIKHDIIDSEARDLIENSFGCNYAFYYFDTIADFNPGDISKVDIELRDKIFLLDLLLVNIDRSVYNPNMFFVNDKLYCHDYSCAILLRMLIHNQKFDSKIFLKEFRNHPFYRTGLSTDKFATELKALNRELLEIHLNKLPDIYVNENSDLSLALGNKDSLIERVVNYISDLSFLEESLNYLETLKSEDSLSRKARFTANRDKTLESINSK